MSQQPQPPSQAPQAPDSPVVVVSGNVQKYAIKKKKILNAEESELFELTQAAGITMDQEVFKIIVDLLKMNVAPQAVFQTLKAMCAGQRIADACAADASTASTASHPAGTATAGTATASHPAGTHPAGTATASHPAGTATAQTTEHREEEPTLVPSKSSKPPAAASSAPGPRAARLGSKILVYGSQDNSSAQGPLSGALSPACTSVHSIPPSLPPYNPTAAERSLRAHAPCPVFSLTQWLQ